MSESTATPAAAGTDTGAMAPAPAEGTAPPSAVSPAAPTTPDPATNRQLADAQRQATEAAEQRDQLQAALDAVNKALNPNAEGEQDPARLAAAVAERDQQLGDAAAQLRTAQVELAAYKAAGEQGARADRLLNSRSFLAAVAQLDPSDGGFAEVLTSAISAAVEADPDLYRAAPVGPARGGADFSAAPSPQLTAAQFAALPYGKRAELHQLDPDLYRQLSAATQ